MARQLFEFDPPERFVAGTVGQPGERTFYLQARGGGRLISVSLEKVQVAALAEKLDELLDEVRRRQGTDSAVPADVPPHLEDAAPLEAPIEEEFRVGTLALAWDDDDGSVLVEAQSMEPESEGSEGDAAGEAPEPAGSELTGSELPGTEPPGTDLGSADFGSADLGSTEFSGDMLRVRMSPAAARAFARRAQRVVAAGRPPCPLCGNPLDPQGHICPRQNGHRG